MNCLYSHGTLFIESQYTSWLRVTTLDLLPSPLGSIFTFMLFTYIKCGDDHTNNGVIILCTNTLVSFKALFVSTEALSYGSKPSSLSTLASLLHDDFHWFCQGFQIKIPVVRSAFLRQPSVVMLHLFNLSPPVDKITHQGATFLPEHDNTKFAEDHGHHPMTIVMSSYNKENPQILNPTILEDNHTSKGYIALHQVVKTIWLLKENSQSVI
jgi:hypothetical protein